MKNATMAPSVYHIIAFLGPFTGTVRAGVSLMKGRGEAINKGGDRTGGMGRLVVWRKGRRTIGSIVSWRAEGGGPKGRDCGSKRSHAGKFDLKVAHAGTVGRHGEILRWTGMGGRTE